MSATATASDQQAPVGAAGPGGTAVVGMTLPAMALVVVFMVFPALWTLYLGTTNLSLTGSAAADPQVVGTANYARALDDPLFGNALRVTAVFVAASGAAQLVIGFALAWLMQQWRGPLRRAVEVVVIVAWLVPASVVSFLWIAFLDGDSGTLNALLPGVAVEWLLEWPLLSIIVFNTWRGAAFAMLLFAAALASIPPSFLDAARLAGAGVFQQLRDIVLPSLRGQIITAALLVTIFTSNTFTPFLITAGGPNFQTETLPLYIYRTAFESGRLGFGAAMSTLLLLINAVLAGAYLLTARRQQ